MSTPTKYKFCPACGKSQDAAILKGGICCNASLFPKYQPLESYESPESYQRLEHPEAFIQKNGSSAQRVDNLGNIAKSIRILGELLNEGLITQQEFDAEKWKVLNMDC